MRWSTWRGSVVRSFAALGVMALVGASAPAVVTAEEACPTSGFIDRLSIPEAHRANVDCAAARDLADGFTDNTYRPARDVARDQMAAFVARLLDEAGVALDEAGDQGFTDLSGNVHARAINRLAAAGIVDGFGDRTYRPRQVVRRDQVASLLLRAAAHARDRDVRDLQGGRTSFTDIADNTHRRNIEGAARLGLVEGRTATAYAPAESTRRDQMASLLIRTLAALRDGHHDPDEATEITLIHDTHLHGTFRDARNGVNVAQYLGLVRERVDAHDHALFLGAGDDLGTTSRYEQFRGAHVVEALNASVLHANTFGNNDFNDGPANVRQRVAESDFTWVSANMRDRRTGEVFAAGEGAREFILTDLGGVRVGLTGIAPANMADRTDLGDEAEEIRARDALDEVVPRMRRAGADLVVVMNHTGHTQARETAAAVDGIDVMVGGDSHESPQRPERHGDTLWSYIGYEFEALGELTVRVHEGEVIDFDFTLHLLDGQNPPDPDPAVEEVRQRWEDRAEGGGSGGSGRDTGHGTAASPAGEPVAHAR
jgi:hypothetical protein